LGMAERLITTETLAKLLVMTSRRVRQLTEEGVLQRARDRVTGEELKGRYLLKESINAYVVFVRDHRYADPAETSYQVSRGKRMAALAEIELLKLRRVRAEMQHGRDVEYLMTQQLTAFKSRLMALPSRLAPTIVNRSSVGEVAESIRLSIYEGLQELSEYDPGKFEAANEEYLAAIGVGKPANSNGQEP
jgi:hypothetical protein